MRLLVIIILIIFAATPAHAYHILSPISKFLIEAKRKEKIDGDDYAEDENEDVRKRLQSVVQEAFLDALHPDQNITDLYSEGVTESDEKVLLLGERIGGKDVTKFCGHLADSQLFHTPIVLLDAIRFKPVRPIPSPVTNLSISIPSRWFREQATSSPTIYVCYEGDSFLKIFRIPSKTALFEKVGKFQRLQVENPYNERCRIRGLLLVLDDNWNNRHLLPRNLEARVQIETNGPVRRMTYTNVCSPKLGLNQECCLWKFEFQHRGETYNFHRCFGRIPDEALKSTLIPVQLADLLVNGEMTRRFISPPAKVCREMAYHPITIRRDEHQKITINRLDATKCAVFF